MKILIFLSLFLSLPLIAEDDCPISHSKSLIDFIESGEKVAPGNCQIKLSLNPFSKPTIIKGKSVEEVLKKCANSGAEEKTCINSVRCTDFEKICESRIAPYKYPGANALKALKLCMLSGKKEAECASSIVCESVPGIGYCEADMGSNRYPGFAVKETVDLCVHSGRDIKDCAGNISCHDFKSLCHARIGEDKYPGATKEEALELCTQAGRNHDICQRNITCL